MKKALLLFFVLSLAPAFGQTSPSAANTHPPSVVAIVNIQDAIVASGEGKKEFDALQARFAPKQEELKALNTEVENLKKDLQAKGDKLSNDERARLSATLGEKQKGLKAGYEDAQKRFQEAQQEVVNQIGGRMLEVLEKYGDSHGYNIVLDVSNPQTPVLWASRGTNITKELVDAYNAQFPVTK